MKFAKWILPAALIVLAAFLLGCTATEKCSAEKTLGVNAQGKCAEFSTSCLPIGWTKVDKCEAIDDKLCGAVTCDSTCEGTTLLSNGKCELGICTYASREENSKVCGYIAKPQLKFETELKHCSYDVWQKFYLLFFQIKNIGDAPTKGKANVYLIGENIPEGNRRILNMAYYPNEFLWYEMKWELPYKGMEWVISNTEKMTYNYKLIYCENEPFTEPCTEENGIVLYEGSTENC